MSLLVSPDELAAAAMQVTAHGENLAAEHMSSDSRIAAAQVGWAGTSAAAISSKIDQWTKTSATLVSRMSDHAQGMHTTAQAFVAHEDRATHDFTGLAAAADRIGGPEGA